MELSARDKLFKGIFIVLSVVISVLIQNTAHLSIEIGGARCFLALPVCVILAIGETEGVAALIGLLGGLLLDVSSGVHTCYNAVFFCLVCFICSALISALLRNTFITNMVFTVSISIMYALLYWLFFIIFKGETGRELTLFTFYLPSALYTLIISPLVWLAARPIKQYFKRKEERKN